VSAKSGDVGTKGDINKRGEVGGREVSRRENFGAEKRLKKSRALGRGGCVFGSSSKQLQRPHHQLVHWWLLVHSSPWTLSTYVLSVQQCTFLKLSWSIATLLVHGFEILVD
jgi:hypothetical protein